MFLLILVNFVYRLPLRNVLLNLNYNLAMCHDVTGLLCYICTIQ